MTNIRYAQNPLTVFVRGELGPELEIVVLSMTLEEQKARIRGRHEGNEDAVGLMEVSHQKISKKRCLPMILYHGH